MRRHRVLIVDDSASMREAVAHFLGAEPDVEIVGYAADGRQAVDLTVRLSPDIVLMDFNMPEMDGLVATATIMRTHPTRVLVMTALDNDSGLNLAFEAVAVGALELVAKPRRGQSLQSWAVLLAKTIRLMVEVPLVSRRKTAARHLDQVSGQGQLEAVGLVSSTGGPQVLAQVLARLPAELSVPLFVVQHMPPGFISGLVRWLGSLTPLKVELAVHGAVARPGTVYFPPDGFDLLVAGSALRLEPAESTFFASGNRLLASLAAVYGTRAGGFVLSGMGEDGAQGLLALRRAGGSTWAQSEDSCVVYGMPRVAWELGAATARVAPDDIAPLILQSTALRP